MLRMTGWSAPTVWTNLNVRNPVCYQAAQNRGPSWCFFRQLLLRAEYFSPRLLEITVYSYSGQPPSDMLRASHMFDDSAKSRNPGEIVLSEAASVLSGKFVSLIRDGFSSSVRRATQQCREYFEVAQQSCRRKDARSSGVNFPDSALETINNTSLKKHQKLSAMPAFTMTRSTI